MRILLLFLSSVSILCWFIILVSIFFFGLYPPYLYLQISLIGFSLWWPRIHNGFHHKLYAIPYKNLLKDVDENDWIPAEFEIEGTEDNLHILPDDIGIIAKKDGMVVIANSVVKSFTFDPSRCIVLAIARQFSSSISIIDKETRARVYAMSITPYYKGDDLEIAGYPKKKIQWFADWLGSELELASS